MEVPRRNWQPEDRRNISREHHLDIEGMAERLLRYFADPERQERREKHVCRFCHYAFPHRIGGAAITTVECSNCGEKMMFGSTCVDILCPNCAGSTESCVHCGGKLD